MLHLTLRVYLRLANRPSAQFANSTNKNNLQALVTATALLQVKEGYQPNKPCCDVPNKISHRIFFHDLLNARKQKKYYRQAINQVLRSSFKKLIVSMPLLL
jgi:hypothetical protein